MSAEEFLAKVPTPKVLRELLTNQGGYYCPKLSDFNNKYCTQLI